MTRLESSAAAPPADVIVVLGAAVWPGGVPSPTLERRVLHAVQLHHDGVADRLLLSGGVGVHPPSEARVMERLATARGVPASHIVLDETAGTTLESARACADSMHRHGWVEAVVVSDRYHLFRAVTAFRAFGVHARGSAPASGRGTTTRVRWLHAYLREAVAIPWYLVRLALVRLRRWRR